MKKGTGRVMTYLICTIKYVGNLVAASPGAFFGGLGANSMQHLPGSSRALGMTQDPSCQFKRAGQERLKTPEESTRIEAMGAWLPKEPFGVFYVLSAETHEEAEAWLHALRPADRLEGKVIALTSVAAAERVYAEIQAKRREDEKKRKAAERAGKIAAQAALIARLASGEEEQEPLAHLRDGVPWLHRWDEVEAHLKDLGQTVMESAAPLKLIALKESFGFGPESDDEPLEKTDIAIFSGTKGNDSSDLGVIRVRKKRRFTLKQAATLIQAWSRGILLRKSLHTLRIQKQKEGEEIREKQLRGLGGYCTKTRRWQRFLPLTPQSSSGVALQLSNLPTWSPRYNLPNLPGQVPVSGGTREEAGLRRRLIPAPLPSNIPMPTPTSFVGSLGAKGAAGTTIDPASRQLERDTKLNKEVLKMKTAELIKELRTRALDTAGSKYELTKRLMEYLQARLDPKAPKRSDVKASMSEDDLWSFPLRLPPARTAATSADAASAAAISLHRDALDWLDP